MIATIIGAAVGFSIIMGLVAYLERQHEKQKERLWRQEQLRLIAEHYAKQARRHNG